MAIKFGMLTSASTIRALSTCPQLTQRPGTTLAVLDPVMISTSGHTLLPDDAIDALKGLFQVVDWVTPNIPEALRLSGQDQHQPISDIQDLIDLARKTAASCNVPLVLLKGGHYPIDRAQLRHLGASSQYRVIYEQGDDEEDTIECLNLWRNQVLPHQSDKDEKVVVDILLQRDGQTPPTLFVGKHVKSDSTHGTGCTLSSAIAAAYAASTIAPRSTGSGESLWSFLPTHQGNPDSANGYSR